MSLFSTVTRLLRWRSGKKSACQCSRCRGHRFNPGSGRAPEGNGKLPSILAWKIPWTEEPGGLVHGVTKSDMTEHITHTYEISLFPFKQPSVNQLDHVGRSGRIKGHCL